MNVFRYEEIELGHREEFSRIITEEMLNKFKELTGDENPMHTNEEYALSKGYEGRICYGMLTTSFLSTLAGMYIPGERSLIHSVETIFKKPVYIGDELTIVGEVTDKDDKFRILEVKIQILNQHGQKVVRGKMRIGVME